MKKSTDELKKNLHDRKDIDQYIMENEGEFKQQSFAELIDIFLEEKKLTKAELLKKTNIYVRYGYEILNGTKKPARDKILQICLALELNVKEAEQLLYSADCASLYPRSVRDSIIMFALDNKLTLFKCNEELFSHGVSILE